MNPKSGIAHLGSGLTIRTLAGLTRGCSAGLTRNEYGILFIFSMFCDYTRLEYVRVHVIYRVGQGGYVIHILVVAPQEYVNSYSTRRLLILAGAEQPDPLTSCLWPL